jgi:hypothetical protein
LSRLITGPGGFLICRATLLDLAVNDIPAGRQLKNPLKAAKGESLIVDEIGYMLDLLDLKIRVNPVVGSRFSLGLDQAHLFVIPNGFL